MAAPDFTAEDFTGAMLALLPTGKVWPRGFDTIVRNTLAGLAPTYARQTARANHLLVDAFPATAEELLAEWESSVGLPDPCQGEAPTVLARQAQVLARFAKSGGQSVPYFIALAAALGYEITITEFSASYFGMPFGGFFGGDDWAYVWQVNAPLVSRQFFEFGQNNFGDPFSIWGNAVLECELQAVKPAHTILLFSYT